MIYSEREPFLPEITNSSDVVLGVICCFSRIDFDLVSPYVSAVLPIVAKVNPDIYVCQRVNPNLFLVPSLIKSNSRISPTRARSSQKDPDAARLFLHDTRRVEANCR